MKKIIKGSLVTHNTSYFPGEPSNLIGLVLNVEPPIYRGNVEVTTSVYTVWWVHGLVIPYSKNSIKKLGLT